MFCTNCTSNQVKPQNLKNLNFVCVGLEGSGKTSILEHLTNQNFTENVHPTKGFNLRVFKFDKRKKITICDCGGNESFRHLWDYYFTDSNGIIYVIDSSNKDDLEESGHELISILNNPSMDKKPLLIYANKNDNLESENFEQISEYLALNDLNDREWIIISSSAKTGEGIFEGLFWLIDRFNQLNEKQKSKNCLKYSFIIMKKLILFLFIVFGIRTKERILEYMPIDVKDQDSKYYGLLIRKFIIKIL